MAMDNLLCAAWRSKAMPDTYLLVDYAEGMDRVPEALKQRFREPEMVTTFALHADRQLARADAGRVMEAIRTQGYFLQLPPAREHEMAALAARNQKLPR